MTVSYFFKLTAVAQRHSALASAVSLVRSGEQPKHGYPLDVEVFRQLPSSPFAYWAGPRVRRLFQEMPFLEAERRMVRVGDHPGDSSRYLRLHWEPQAATRQHGWPTYQKGGEYSPFFSDPLLVANWDESRQTYRGFLGRKGRASERPSNFQFFFVPGLTWSRRSQRGLSVRPHPADAVFADKGPVLLAPREELAPLLALMNSSGFRGLVGLRVAFGSFEVGVLQSTPCPSRGSAGLGDLGRLAKESVRRRRQFVTASETAHLFQLPALVQTTGATLNERAAVWQSRLDDAHRQLVAIQTEIDEIVFDLYGLEEEDRQALLESLGESSVTEEGDSEDDEEDGKTTVEAAGLVVDLLSYAIGAAFGRFDVRYATGELEAANLPDPFAPLPACSPGMLTGDDCLPLEVEPAGYSLRVSWYGVLVDDPGLVGGGSHADDIVSRVRELLALLWGERAEEIEHEACGLLGAKTLREYFRKPSGFFVEHLKRYSKSRRQAPIYWPLTTASGSYTLWLYYPRLDEDLLYTAVNRYLEPKMSAVGRRLDELDGLLPTTAGRDATELRKEREELSALQAELADLRAELLRVAALPYKPDLDDGVLICAAPLAKLFRLAKWRKDLEACWKKLEDGDFDWAHLAYAVWPERVLEACRRDRSIAIAHGVEEAFEG